MRSPTMARIAQMPVVWIFSRKLVSCTRVAESTASPAFWSPMNAINRPIPTDTARFSESGIESKMASLTFVSDRIMKMIPSMNTASRATCHE